MRSHESRDAAAGASGGAGVELRFIERDDPLYAAATELRYEALYSEWGLPRSLVEDADGREYRHIVAVLADRVVGYARLRLEAGDSKILQVCVAPDMRRRGVARALMTVLEEEARRAGRAETYLDARIHVVDVYRRLGYVPTGGPFTSPRTGTLHQEMCKWLSEPSSESARP